MSRVLVIDDDPGVRGSTERMLRNAGFTVVTAESGEKGVELALGGAFDVILSDMRMPGISGLDVLRQLRERGVDATMIIMTAFGTVESAVEAMKLGAVDYVQKPFLKDELVLRVKAAVERRQLVRQVRLLQRHVPAGDSLSAIVGNSPAIERVRTFIRRAGSAAGTVLITGETGTGKELVARAIHHESPRAGGPFVAVNCAALAESLLENELFGHARGAFTGAVEAWAGLIEHAHRGTLLLDEIGAMPGALQPKLLRALETGEVRRIGENDSRLVDLRFVAATNTDLKAAVAAGAFREDLFYRLNVLHIHLPPLRERREDLAVLVRHFLQRYGAGSGVLRVSAQAEAALLGYEYPGNVRELEHVIQRAVAVAQSEAIEVADLAEDVVRATAGASARGDGVAAARERAEREQLLAALERHRGDLMKTARELKISRTTLWRLMRKHEISGRA